MATESTSLLRDLNAILTDTHVVYTSGRHGSAYVNKDAIYPHTEATSALCLSIAQEFAVQEPEIVAAPALGGIILSQWTAHHLTELGHHSLAVFAEKGPTGDLIFTRGYDRLLRGRRVLVVEDILTTGGSLKKVIDLVREHEGNVVGAAAICNRGGITPEDVGNPPILFSLAKVELESWAEDECELCKRGVPVNTTVGKGAEFLRRRAQSG